MRKRRFRVEQMIGVLKQAELGVLVVEEDRTEQRRPHFRGY
jgi:hypothetical protein